MKITRHKLVITAMLFIFCSLLSAQNYPFPMLPKNWKSLFYAFSALKWQRLKKDEKPRPIESNVITITVYDCKDKVVQ
jgi:hypothetical protein